MVQQRETKPGERLRLLKLGGKKLQRRGSVNQWQTAQPRMVACACLGKIFFNRICRDQRDAPGRSFLIIKLYHYHPGSGSKSQPIAVAFTGEETDCENQKEARLRKEDDCRSDGQQTGERQASTTS